MNLLPNKYHNPGNFQTVLNKHYSFAVLPLGINPLLSSLSSPSNLEPGSPDSQSSILKGEKDFRSGVALE